MAFKFACLILHKQKYLQFFVTSESYSEFCLWVLTNYNCRKEKANKGKYLIKPLGLIKSWFGTQKKINFNNINSIKIIWIFEMLWTVYRWLLATVCMKVYEKMSPYHLGLGMKSLFSNTWFSQAVSSCRLYVTWSLWREQRYIVFVLCTTLLSFSCDTTNWRYVAIVSIDSKRHKWKMATNFSGFSLGFLLIKPGSGLLHWILRINLLKRYQAKRVANDKKGKSNWIKTYPQTIHHHIFPSHQWHLPLWAPIHLHS